MNSIQLSYVRKKNMSSKKHNNYPIISNIYIEFKLKNVKVNALIGLSARDQKENIRLA